jgi:hypothetical protein
MDVTVVDASDSGPADTARDAPVDANTCTFRPDPTRYFFVHNFVNVGNGSNIMTGANNSLAGFSIKSIAPVTPTETSPNGQCFYNTIKQRGSDAANTAPSVNIGNIHVTDGTRTGVFTWNGTTYAFSGIASTQLATPGAITSYSIDPITDGGAARTGMFAFPPLMTPALVAAVPSTVSRSMPFTFDITPPTGAGSGPDLATVLWIFDETANNVVVCAVPACSGHISVPASMMMHFNETQMITTTIAFARSVVAPAAAGEVEVDFRANAIVQSTRLVGP